MRRTFRCPRLPRALGVLGALYAFGSAGGASAELPPENQCPTLGGMPGGDVAQDAAPWMISAPVMLPPGNLAEAAGGGPVWWCSADAAHCLPVANAPPPQIRGMALEAAAAIWDGARLSLLAAQSDWGRLAFDA